MTEINLVVFVTTMATMPLKVTAVALPKLVPVMVTFPPTIPVNGVKLVIVGTPTRVKLAALVPVPLRVVTPTLPVVAPTGTVAVIWVGDSRVKVVAVVVLNFTVVTLMKLVPVMVTLLPATPEAGDRADTVGTGGRRV